MVATTVFVVSFIAVNDGMSPVPLAANPIAGLSLVHS